MGGNEKLINLIKSARIERSFPSISLIIFICAYIGKINNEIYLLSICLILLYATGGILNAIKDKDYELPKYSKTIVYLLPLITLIISINHPKILLASISWIVLGFVYNVLSRKILLADTTIMSITHYFIPIIFTFLILKQKIIPSIEIATMISIIFWLIIPLKNLNGIKKDKKLGYKTLPTMSNHGKEITIMLFYASLPLIINLYFFLNLNSIFIPMLILIGIMYIATGKTFSYPNKYFAIPLTRLTMVILAFALTLGSTTNIKFILAQIPFILYFTQAFLKEYKK